MNGKFRFCLPFKTSPSQNVPKPKRPLVKTSQVKTSLNQNVPKPKRPLVSSQSVVSVEVVTIEFYQDWKRWFFKLLVFLDF